MEEEKIVRLNTPDGVILISSHNRYIENKKSHLEIALFTSYPEPITTKLMFPTYTALDEFLLAFLAHNSLEVPIFLTFNS